MTIPASNASSCAELMDRYRQTKMLSNGVYGIYDEIEGYLSVYCVFDYTNNYGWTLIQSASRSYLTTSDFIGKAFVNDVSYNTGLRYSPF